MAGDREILSVHPQYLNPTTAEAGMLHGKVVLTERLGSETVVDTNLHDGSTIIATICEDRVINPGATIGFTFDSAQAHLFR